MGVSVEDSVEMTVELVRPEGASDTPAVAVRMFGPLTVMSDGAPLALPASRKVRALFAYLALAPSAVTRSHLCELLWEVPNDPRGELRWCLSKIRGVTDRYRIETRADTIRLDLADCVVDAIEISDAMADAGTLDLPRLRRIAELIRGDFLDGLDIDRSPNFTAWLTAQRRRFRDCHAAVLQRLAENAPEDEAPHYLARWLALAPFDLDVHGRLFNLLAQRGQIREGEEHLAASVRSFEAEGLDPAPLRIAWRAAKAQRSVLPSAAPIVADTANERAAMPASGLPRRASIAVMPFIDQSAMTPGGGGMGDGLAFDVIARLAKLRSIFVIAQGTVFALHERGVSAEEAARILNVDYVVSGAVRRRGNRVVVLVELAETRSARIVWTDSFDHMSGDSFLILDEIGDRIVASIANEIETVERNRAILKPPNSLDAWEAHHRGLWHMYRFNRTDNEQAQHYFRQAIRQDPTFSRAHAGLSFTHWQNAFQGWASRDVEIERAYAAAGQSLMADERDPAAHWAMGRALLLRGRHDQSIVELGHAIELSPNFALGHYMVALVNSQSGDPSAAIAAADRSRSLSPFDPLLFGPLGARALALARLGQFDEAGDWAIKAAARPNAHAHILAIAALTLALAGRLEEARQYLAVIYATVPQYCIQDFLTAMLFAADGERLFRDAARRLGMR